MYFRNGIQLNVIQGMTLTATVLVGHLSNKVTRDHLVEIFLPYGNIKSVSVVSPQKTDCGAVYQRMMIAYEKSSDALRAVKYMHGGMIDKHEITVEMSPATLVEMVNKAH
jgi:RNA recognition motif-containing protein